jgi:hypothetical protein
MSKEETAYVSYLLRLWRDSESESAWRASLESPQTGERRGFASLDDLFSFLQDEGRKRRVSVTHLCQSRK